MLLMFEVDNIILNTHFTHFIKTFKLQFKNDIWLRAVVSLSVFQVRQS